MSKETEAIVLQKIVSTLDELTTNMFYFSCAVSLLIDKGTITQEELTKKIADISRSKKRPRKKDKGRYS